MVMTPQIFLDAAKHAGAEYFGKFTLLIFDECHHTAKGHPYNAIMGIYVDEKISKNQTVFLPQVRGDHYHTGRSVNISIQCII